MFMIIRDKYFPSPVEQFTCMNMYRTNVRTFRMHNFVYLESVEAVYTCIQCSSVTLHVINVAIYFNTCTCTCSANPRHCSFMQM